jgi:hypothetical protein
MSTLCTQLLKIATTPDKNQEEDQEKDRLTVSKKFSQNITWESEMQLLPHDA